MKPSLMKHLNDCPRRPIIPALIAGALLATSAVFAAHTDSGHILFRAMQQDVPVEGEFKRFAADIAFDPAKPQAGKVDLVIDLASVSTGTAQADELLRSSDFFDAARFANASFASTAITTGAGGGYQAKGQLTIKGHRAEVAVPFTAQPDSTGLRLQGSVTVSRLAFKIGEGEWADPGTLADPVQIRFDVHLPK